MFIQLPPRVIASAAQHQDNKIEVIKLFRVYSILGPTKRARQVFKVNHIQGKQGVSSSKGRRTTSTAQRGAMKMMKNDDDSTRAATPVRRQQNSLVDRT